MTIPTLNLDELASQAEANAAAELLEAYAAYARALAERRYYTDRQAAVPLHTDSKVASAAMQIPASHRW